MILELHTLYIHSSILHFLHFFTDTLLNSRMLATVAGTCSNVSSQMNHFLASPLWYVSFLPTLFPWIQPFFKNNKYPPGIHEVKVNLLLMKQEADSFSFTTTYQKKTQNKTLQVSKVCTQVWASITSITPELQGEITIRPVWTCYLQAAELIYALLMCCHTGSVSCRQIKR